MNVLVVGGGGREHALCWSFSRSPLCSALYCAPGNAGIASIATCVPLMAEDITALVKFCQDKAIDFVMVGPEAPLTIGLADAMRAIGVPCFGPTQAAAQLEGSKSFMKDLCAQHGIPTAAYARFTDPAEARAYVQERGVPIVVKADGLAAGKGVTLARTMDEAVTAIDDALVRGAFGEAGAEIVIEEFMVGEEASFFALCDGVSAVPFAAAQDHKAVHDGDTGPNTGGMGAYSPAPCFDAAMQERVMRTIIQPTVDAMRANGTPFTGVLFAGLMLTAEGPKLLEYNVRFGDPETQAMLPRLRSDLLALLYAFAKGLTPDLPLQWHDLSALCVVMASNGYPGPYAKNTVIGGLEAAAGMPDSIVFHAGTATGSDGAVLATGGRVLGVTGWAPTIAEAQTRAYHAVDAIVWPDGFCRRDIGWRVLKPRAA